MHRIAYTCSVFMLGTVLLSACSKGSPTAPSPTPSPTVTVTSIAVTGSNAVDVRTTSRLTATATKSDGTTEDVTSTATWQSSNTAVATVSNSGQVTAVSPGSSTISAAFEGRTGQLNLEVRAVDDVQRVTVRLTTLVINGTCDENSIFEDERDGEFSFRFHIVRDGGESTIWSTGTTAFTRGSHDRTQSQTFARNVTRGEDFLLQFSGTEYDGLLGADPRLSGRFANRSHVYSGGQWSGGRSLTIGNSVCGATMNYTITSTPATP